MKKIVVLFTGDIFNRKGSTNASLERAWHLQDNSEFDVDVVCIQEYWSLFGRFLRTKCINSFKKIPSVDINNHSVILLWKRKYIIDYILEHKCNRRPLMERFFFKRILSRFQKYDLISAHMDLAGEIARRIKCLYNIPFCITWHGSDIHTAPFIYSYQRILVKRIIESADINFFVSKNLKDVSDEISRKGNKVVLYNGVSTIFHKYEKSKVLELKKSFNLDINDKVVGFVGGLVPVKNIYLLPQIFSIINEKYDGHVVFWVVGDGKLRTDLERGLREWNVSCVIWGNQPVDRIPDYMNCMDILLLPSKNEGMPLVTLEALACGVNVIGSDVGGVKESIGENFVYPLDESFVKNITSLALDILKNGHITQPFNNELDWTSTVIKEISLYKKLFINKE